ncbi:GNAT family N-acetyltransferase [Aquibacillus koreensis]|uniref:GNAT family N-acetyltransferase n=1 Tax=Aquibacillus koreensis TaxID=279446 RepID=A0A9X4AIT8_9BACI|nr:GNAT family N-acetyltransferase [Aquibacillus koreensis]MCT2535215.1 GNAT family N-acetyltransferase [Aquibacillus koreensis]MDC3421074.1 GNAT family N-acetyltransferase [Aquibacillus koreensis]
MQTFKTKNFHPDDREQVVELFNKLKDKHTNVIYWWPGEEEHTWEYCPCVYERDKLIGKGQIMPISVANPGDNPHVVHQLYMNIKVDPDYDENSLIKEQLYEILHEKALQMKAYFSPGFKTFLRVGNFSNEIENNAFFQSIGFKHFSSNFWMDIDLRADRQSSIPRFEDQDIEIKMWEMKTEIEEQQYLQVENKIWPEDALTLHRLREYKERPHWTTFTAFYKGKIIGSVMAWERENEEKTGEIEDVFVVPEWRNKGIARHLLMLAVHYLQQKKLDRAILLVLTDNDSALNLYKSVGFKVKKEEQRFELEI